VKEIKFLIEDEASDSSIDFYLNSVVEHINRMAVRQEKAKRETAAFKADLPIIQAITPYLVMRYRYNHLPDTLEELETMRQQDMATYGKNAEPRRLNALLVQRVKDIFHHKLENARTRPILKRKDEKHQSGKNSLTASQVNTTPTDAITHPNR